MTGITLERPLRTEFIAYFHCGPLQKLFADKEKTESKKRYISIEYNNGQ